jgi:hypothetical protein
VEPHGAVQMTRLVPLELHSNFSHSTIQLLCSFFFINGEKNEAVVVFLKLEWCVYTLA